MPAFPADLLTGARAWYVERSGATTPAALACADDGDSFLLTVEAEVSRALRISLPLGPDEHLAGFGEQFIQVDKRGRLIDGWIGLRGQQFSWSSRGLDGGYAITPIWHSSHGYAAMVETTQRWSADLGVFEGNRLSIDLTGTRLAIRLFPGMPSDTLPVITRYIGRPVLAPHWCYGVWKNVRGGDQAVVEEAARFRAEGVGCGVLWLDAHWDPDTNSGAYGAGSYEAGEFPDMAATVAELEAYGFKALSYVNPYLYKYTPAHDIAVAAGHAVKDAAGEPVYVTSVHPTHGDAAGHLAKTGIHTLEDGCGLVDFTNPAARAWWQGMIEAILAQGFSGWMQDFAEDLPAHAVMADGRSGAVVHNEYPELYQQAAFDVIERTNSDAAFFVRSGYMRSPSIAAVKWPGDQVRDWRAGAGIRSVPAAGISAGLMGYAAWGPDIAGMMDFIELGDPAGGGSADEELWARWCQMGAMSPVMRHHLGFLEGVPVDVWTSESATEAWRSAAAWHHAHFPYLWSLAHEARETGLPVLRGLMFAFPNEPHSWVVNDQWMLGEALLCAPVLEAGARSRTIWLPAGEWFATSDGTRHEGGRDVTIDAAIGVMPVLQRGGSVLPRLIDVPLDVNARTYAEWDFDVEIVVAGVPRSCRLLGDGTSVTVDGDTLVVDGPRRRGYRVVGVDGTVLDEQFDRQGPTDSRLLWR